MIKKLFAVSLSLILLITLFIPKAEAEAPIAPVKTAWTIDEVKSLVDYYADMYHVKRATMQAVVNCESSYDYDIIGDHGHSYGLAQIYRPAHPDISKEEAINANFALDYMASQIADGNGSQWTCYRLYKNNQL